MIQEPDRIQLIVELLTEGPPDTVGRAGQQIHRVDLFLTIGERETEHGLLIGFFPDRDVLYLENVPNAGLPNKLVGEYKVSPQFGAALFEALDGD